MSLKAEIFVTLKKSVLDPQGQTIQGALHSLGHQEVSDVRVGKYIVIHLNHDDENDAKNQINTMCEKLLANLVIEEYSFTIHSAAESAYS